ncbi:MAG: DUF499 domain-containing protein [Thermodesulfobacteriota bacterium]|nr:DUF499 domain-containing protein [Thermodesulfobacteriota bacterium]
MAIKTIMKTCEPRQDILRGTFNPEIFTASISEVLRYYNGHSSEMHPMYTDAQQFFQETTWPTDGLKMVIFEVFARLAGDNTVPAIHRLETAFGGGKTHTLIACAHIGFKGTEISSFTSDLISDEYLPEPGSVAVVGIAGDELPVHKPKGSALVPYTLWGEIAFRIGGESLYMEIKEEASSYASPGKNYFDKVFGNRKVLLMLDELAQYTARLAAAHPDGADQLAAFLMGLHGYARTNPNIAILLTLASATDAFANQTEQLARLLGEVVGKDVTKDAALGIGQQAIGSVTSVVFRDAAAVVPVQAAEISRVLAKRLFAKIDTNAAQETAKAYENLYRKNTSLLPDEATRTDYKDRMISLYPFHPTLINFLNHKLAVSENFQGTRGVLRVLALAVRNLWKKQVNIPMIHACHIDFRDARTVNEIIGRTGSGDLLPVLNADIGGADTDQIDGGRSNAEIADQKNPHPEQWPMYEYTWKTIFLHSLVGRDSGLSSNLFGLTEQDALFNVAFPGLTPPQVNEALKEIGNSAFYLRFNQGRYYASLEPSVNIALAKIRRTLGNEEVDDFLDSTARKIIRPDIKTFQVVHDVTAPEHIPDNKGKPVLTLIALGAKSIDVEECITFAGINIPRIEQNLVFMLIPDTVAVKTDKQSQTTIFGKADSASLKSFKRLRDLASTVLAMRRLNQNPQNHGINPNKLNEDNFKKRFSERENALITSVSASYHSLWFPSASGQVIGKEIKTSGAEGGQSILEQIRKTLLDEGELVTSDHTTQADLLNLKILFLSRQDVVSVTKLRENFSRIRKWPVLESPAVLDQLIRAGVSKGVWCVFRMGTDESVKPDEFYSREVKELPFNVDLTDAYSILTPEGARQRGWSEEDKIDQNKIKDYVKQIAVEKEQVKISELVDTFKQQYGDVPDKAINDAVAGIVQDDRLMACKGELEQQEKPELISGTGAMFYQPEPEDVIITKAKASEKGWIKKTDNEIHLGSADDTKILFQMLKRIGSIYQRGASTTIDMMSMHELILPKGGKIRIDLADIPPESVKDLSELFEVLASLVKMGDDTIIELDIDKPQDNCPFIKEIRKAIKR